MTNHAIDWGQIVDDLAAHLGGAGEICSRAGVARSSLRDWGSGRSEPRHSNGEALMVLWESATGRDREHAPRRAQPVEAKPPKRAVIAGPTFPTSLLRPV